MKLTDIFLSEQQKTLNELGVADAFTQQFNDRILNNEYFEVGLYKLPENHRKTYSGKRIDALLDPQSKILSQNIANRPAGYQEIEPFRTSKSVNSDMLFEQDSFTGHFIPLGLYFISDGLKKRAKEIFENIKNNIENVNPDEKFLIPVFNLNLNPYHAKAIRWDSPDSLFIAQEHSKYLTARETKTNFHSMGTDMVIIIERNAITKAMLIYGANKGTIASRKGLTILDKWQDLQKHEITAKRRESIDINKQQKHDLFKKPK